MEVKYTDFIKFNKAPNNANHIGVYDKNGTKIINVNLASMLFYRQKFCDEVNAKFGTNISVDFSECWRDSREEMQELYTDGNDDETATKGSEDNEQSDETV